MAGQPEGCTEFASQILQSRDAKKGEIMEAGLDFRDTTLCFMCLLDSAVRERD